MIRQYDFNISHAPEIPALQKAIVIGKGHSAWDFRPPDGPVTIGLNDLEAFIPKDCRLDWLLSLDGPGATPANERQTIYRTRAKVFWFTSDVWARAKRDGVEFRRINIRDARIHMIKEAWRWQWASSSVAGVMLAYAMGHRDIAVVGCDMLRHRILRGRIAHEVNRQFDEMYKRITYAGGNLVNISSMQGLLTVLPRVDVESWIGSTSPSPMGRAP